MSLYQVIDVCGKNPFYLFLKNSHWDEGKIAEMSLFITLTLITFVNAYKTRLISMVLKLIPQNRNVNTISKNIIILEKELSTISMVSEFAKHAKLQRKIIKLKEEKKELVKNNSFKLMKIRYSLITAMYVVIVISLVTIVWSYRSEPVVQVPEHWLWPISSLFDWSNYTPGFITVPCWVAISSTASKTFAKHF